MNSYQEKLQEAQGRQLSAAMGAITGMSQNVGRLPNAGQDKFITPERGQRVRVIATGWYGPHRKPVELGESFVLALSDAQGARKSGRVEFI